MPWSSTRPSGTLTIPLIKAPRKGQLHDHPRPLLIPRPLRRLAIALHAIADLRLRRRGDPAWSVPTDLRLSGAVSVQRLRIAPLSHTALGPFALHRTAVYRRERGRGVRAIRHA